MAGVRGEGGGEDVRCGELGPEPLAPDCGVGQGDQHGAAVRFRKLLRFLCLADIGAMGGVVHQFTL